MSEKQVDGQIGLQLALDDLSAMDPKSYPPPKTGSIVSNYPVSLLSPAGTNINGFAESG